MHLCPCVNVQQSPSVEFVNYKVTFDMEINMKNEDVCCKEDSQDKRERESRHRQTEGM